MPKICIITTIDLSLDILFPDFFPLLINRGYRVIGICADTTNGKHTELLRTQGVHIINIPMTRNFTPWQDLKCFIRLRKIFKKEKFDIIHYSTPKASLLAALASWKLRNTFKLYTLRGLGYMAFTGLKHRIGKTCEKITCSLSDQIIAISPSLLDVSVEEKLIKKQRIKVLGRGSSKGVNLEKFTKTDMLSVQAKQLRRSMSIDDGDVVVGYVGRLTKEKGLLELYEAYKSLVENNENLHLMLVGGSDQRNPLSRPFMKKLETNLRIHLIGHKDDITPFLTAMDILVLPSHREGFGNVAIEASAMNLPVVATDIPGIRDAVADKKTGILFETGNIKVLENALNKLIERPDLRYQMGNQGRTWVEENFDRRQVWQHLLNVYDEIIKNGSCLCNLRQR